MDEELRQINLTSPTQVRRLLTVLGLRAHKNFGQNFLIDANILHRIVEEARLTKNDTVLEIGAGLGVLTEALLATARKVIAIEKDNGLHAYLQSRFADDPSLTLIHADAMEVAWAEVWPVENRIVVANLPYSVGTRMMLDLIELPTPPNRMVFMLQADVVHRMLAAPGSKDYGLLSIFVQNDYALQLAKLVPATCFFPAPQVGSAVVVCDRRSAPLSQPVDRALWRALLHWVFAHRRKQIATLLKQAPFLAGQDLSTLPEVLNTIGLQAQTRPEEISVPEWGRLADALCALKRNDQQG